MTRQQICRYQLGPGRLRDILEQHRGLKVRLDCGHYLTIAPGNHLANDFVVRQGSGRIVCALCAYEGA